MFITKNSKDKHIKNAVNIILLILFRLHGVDFALEVHQREKSIGDNRNSIYSCQFDGKSIIGCFRVISLIISGVKYRVKSICLV